MRTWSTRLLPLLPTSDQHMLAVVFETLVVRSVTVTGWHCTSAPAGTSQLGRPHAYRAAVGAQRPRLRGSEVDRVGDLGGVATEALVESCEGEPGHRGAGAESRRGEGNKLACHYGDD